MKKINEYEICYKFKSNGFIRSILVNAENEEEAKSKAYEELRKPKEVYFSEPVLSDYIY